MEFNLIRVSHSNSTGFADFKAVDSAVSNSASFLAQGSGGFCDFSSSAGVCDFCVSGMPPNPGSWAYADHKYRDLLCACQRQCAMAVQTVDTMDRLTLRAGGTPLSDLLNGPKSEQLKDVQTYQQIQFIITEWIQEENLRSAQDRIQDLFWLHPPKLRSTLTLAL